MTYELAKQLKDAGFEQKLNVLGNGHFDVYIPSLSELIEAVKEINHDFNLNIYIKRENITFAEVTDFGQLVEQQNGSTPEQAVAKLWLELNKK